MKNINRQPKISLSNLTELCVEELNEKEMETVQGGNKRKSLMSLVLKYFPDMVG